MKFYFHYNKPASKQAGKNVLSIHFKKTCHLVNKIVCGVPIESRDRKNQPRCIMVGSATEIKIRDGIALIQ